MLNKDISDVIGMWHERIRLLSYLHVMISIDLSWLQLSSLVVITHE